MTPWLADIYQTHRRGLYALALSVLRRPELAEDAVHDAFVKMTRLKAVPDGDPVSYTFACVRNAALDLRGKQAQIGASGTGAAGADIQAIDLVAANPVANPAAQVLLGEEKARVQAALGRLNPDDREVILLRLWSNLSFQQIGEACHEPLGTIASRYYRALTQLRRLLSEPADSNSTPPPPKEARHAS
jgi:RNA polymerase sigma-70 factor (ECF subfamily)